MRPQRKDSNGLFWTNTPSQRRVAAPAGPVILKPYQARPPQPYEEATREELIAGAGGTMVFDTECFDNYFLVAFKNIATKKVTKLYLNTVTDDYDFNENKLKWIMQNYRCIGFNSTKYDLPLIWAAYRNQNTGFLKEISDAIILRGEWSSDVICNFDIIMKHTDHIDLIEVCPLRGSLKLYSGRLHAKRLLDLPWAGKQSLEDWQIPITENYCITDLEDTELLFDNLKEQMQLRYDLTDEYKEDLRSKSDAQIAEAVISSELIRLTKKRPPKPKPAYGKEYKFVPRENLFFQSDYMKNVLQTVADATFVVDSNGYLICPNEILKLEVKLGNSVYRMGIGGLHSSEKRMAVVADDNHILFDSDAASYYPRMILNGKLTPVNLGESFLIVYQSLVDKRLAAKAIKNLAVSENLKVAINGAFGKTGSPHSILYSPASFIQICLGGQLYQLMLIERMEAAGIPVISANTDGSLMHCHKDKEQLMLETIKQWAGITNFDTDETRYKAVYARDVNAYVAVKLDGTIKAKNVYYDPWKSTSAKDLYWRFQKNPTCQICAEAIELLITKGTPIEETIKENKDITRFVAIKNVAGGAHYNGEYLGKVVRWYYAKGETGTINYIKNNHLVGTTEGAKPLMDLPDEFPDDINYDFYIEKTKGMLDDMGWKND